MGSRLWRPTTRNNSASYTCVHFPAAAYVYALSSPPLYLSLPLSNLAHLDPTHSVGPLLGQGSSLPLPSLLDRPEPPGRAANERTNEAAAREPTFAFAHSFALPLSPSLSLARPNEARHNFKQGEFACLIDTQLNVSLLLKVTRQKILSKRMSNLLQICLPEECFEHNMETASASAIDACFVHARNGGSEGSVGPLRKPIPPSTDSTASQHVLTARSPVRDRLRPTLVTIRLRYLHFVFREILFTN